MNLCERHPDAIRRPNGQCRGCYNARQLAWYHANRREVADRRRLLAKRPGAIAKSNANTRKWRMGDQISLRARNMQTRARAFGVVTEYVIPLAVFEMQDGVCGICRNDLDPATYHIDHIEPLSQGGANTYLNVQAVHHECNSRKWTKTMEEVAP